MLKISVLENKHEATALTHFDHVCIIVDGDDILGVIFSYLVGIDAIAKFCRLIMFQI